MKNITTKNIIIIVLMILTLNTIGFYVGFPELRLLNIAYGCTPPPPPWDDSYIVECSGDYNFNAEEPPAEFWPASNTYHIIDDLTITNGTLVIEPGTIIKIAYDKRITVGTGGAIIACGKPYRPIIFTSEDDDDLGEPLEYSDHSPASGDYYGLQIGDGSKVEFCRFIYADTALSVLDMPAAPVRHNSINKCDVGIYVTSNALNSGDALELFNNLIVDCDSRGMNIHTGDIGDGEIIIRNNTLHYCDTGIMCTGENVANITIENCLITGYYIGIADCSSTEDDPVLDHNAFDNNGYCTFADIDEEGVHVDLTTSPYWGAVDSFDSLGYYYLNTASGGGNDLIEAGNCTIEEAGYDDPCAWAIYHVPCDPCDPCQCGFATDTTIDESKIWKPQYNLCDSGDYVAIGYHHPRIDYCLDNAKVTFSNGSAFTFTINSGTVIAHIPADNNDYLDIGQNCSLTCEGNPYDGGDIIFSNGSLIAQSPMGMNLFYHGYCPGFYIESSAGTANIVHTQFNALGIPIQANRTMTIENSVFRLNCCPFIAEYTSTGTSSVTNCLFSQNDGIWLKNSYSGADFLNCTFSQDDLPGGLTYVPGRWTNEGVYSSGATFSVINCLFDELQYGLWGTGTCTENNNAFYHLLDPVFQLNSGNENGTDRNLGDNNPYIEMAEWPEDNPDNRFFLDQESDAVDNGDSITTGYEGASTDIKYPMDVAPVDIGYHYPRYTIYVDCDATGNDDGTSWTDAFDTISEGFTEAINFYAEIILVADGTYSGSNNRDLDFENYAMVVLGIDGPENCIIDCQSSGRAFYIDNTGFDNEVIIQGFTIQNGSVANGCGAGIYINDSKVDIKNCIIKSNSATGTGKGGGIYHENSFVNLDHCLLFSNSAPYGGGIYAYDNASEQTLYGEIVNCTFTKNNVTMTDGGAAVLVQRELDKRFSVVTPVSI